MNMNDATRLTLSGKTIQLRVLEPADAPALVDAATDGLLWNLKVTVVPGPSTIDRYITSALRGYEEGHVIPFVVITRSSDLPRNFRTS
jgi:hypothetical protein